jgi:hypothetical protein
MKSPKDGVVAVADRRLERDGLLRHLHDLLHAVDGQVHLVGHLVRGRLVAVLLEKLLLDLHDLVQRLDHVDRDADRAGLVGDGAGDRLADPPGRVGGELVAAAVLELLDGLHEAHVALLDEVEEGEAAVRVLLRDGDDEAQVGLDHLGLRAVRLAHVGHRLLVDLRQLGGRDPLLQLDGAQLVVDRAGVDRRVLLRLRVLGAVELVVEELDLLEDRAQLLQVLLVDLQLEEELREVRPERGLAPAELGEGLLALGLRAGLRLLDPGLLGAGLRLLRRVSTSFGSVLK